MIVTFYSYKGGVGRSMALANVADLLARAGRRVLMVDFDLEAPGLEHFFPIDHDGVRSGPGLLDLLLTYKYAMSTAGAPDAFRDLDRFVTPVYPERPGGGRLDLIHAGARRTDEQLARYGRELRRFDWLDFYFEWSGELLFEWLRQEVTARYDVVLVDSRTGVTEMGGVCAYQLADVIVVPCAPNQQNLRGTESMVRHFRSPDVLAVRDGRPIELLVVPARVEQADEESRRLFEATFTRLFAGFRPPGLSRSLWELQIPYDPRWAYDERVVTDPGRVADRRGLARAYGRLVEAIEELAPPGTPLAVREPAVETAYDPTTRHRPADVFVSCAPDARPTARAIGRALEGHGLLVGSTAEALPSARLGVVLHSAASAGSADQRREVERLLSTGRPVLPVRLSGAPAAVPWRLPGDPFPLWSPDAAGDLAAEIVAVLSATERAAGDEAAPEVNPYPGTAPFGPDNAAFLFGRDEELAQLRRSVAEWPLAFLVGPPGSGRTSLLAALEARLRDDGEPWRIIRVRGEAAIAEADRVLMSALGERVMVIVDDADEPARRSLLGELTARARAGRLQFLIAADGDRLWSSSRRPPAVGQVTMIRPLRPDRVRDVIERQARAAGVALEPGLAGRLLADAVRHDAVDLRMVQLTLWQLWQHRAGGYLTHAAYERLGGFAGVVSKRFDEVLTGLRTPEAVRRILMALVTYNGAFVPGPGLTRAELTDAAGGPPAADALDALIDGGLVTPVDDDRRLGLVHPALLTDALVTSWLKSEQTALRARAGLDRSAQIWRDSGRESVWPFSRQALTRSLDEVGDLWLAPDTREFVRRCRRAVLHRYLFPVLALLLLELAGFVLVVVRTPTVQGFAVVGGVFAMTLGATVAYARSLPLRAAATPVLTSRRDSSAGSAR